VPTGKRPVAKAGTGRRPAGLVKTLQNGENPVGPGYYVIAILGCADGSAACTQVATVPVRYESRAACSAAAPDALISNSDLDFPTLVAECQSVLRPAAGSDERPRSIPAAARRG
jgi:hypothetical protein